MECLSKEGWKDWSEGNRKELRIGKSMKDVEDDWWKICKCGI